MLLYACCHIDDFSVSVCVQWFSKTHKKYIINCLLISDLVLNSTLVFFFQKRNKRETLHKTIVK